MGAKILSWQTGKRIDAKEAKRTTLSSDYPCDVCGEPAMTKDGGQLRCPSCWLRENKPVDWHARRR